MEFPRAPKLSLDQGSNKLSLDQGFKGWQKVKSLSEKFAARVMSVLGAVAIVSQVAAAEASLPRKDLMGDLIKALETESEPQETALQKDSDPIGDLIRRLDLEHKAQKDAIGDLIRRILAKEEAEAIRLGIDERTIMEVHGFVGFCHAHPEDINCTEFPLLAERIAWKDFEEKLQRINREVNKSIVYTPDEKLYGRLEHWTYPKSLRGDCEDYALEKKRRLIAAGVPAGALRLAVGFTKEGIGHAVLLVATDKGNLVLDLHDEILPLSQSSLVKVVAIQGNEPQKWHAVMPNPHGVVRWAKEDLLRKSPKR